ncbi:hypothetical protein [Bacteroides sedimenti]
MRLYVLILVVGLCSCNNQKKQVFLISNNDVKYWDEISPRNNSLRGFCFHKNGFYEYYVYYKGKRYKYGYEDVIFPDNWSCLNDSTLIIGYYKAHILKLTNDYFIFQVCDDKSIQILEISNNQTDTVISRLPHWNDE